MTVLGPIAGLVLIILAALFEGTGLWMLSRDDGVWPIAGALAAHVASAGLCAEGLHLRGLRRVAPEVLVSLRRAGWVLGLGLPVFGPLAALLVGFQSARERSGRGELQSLEAKRSRAAKDALERKRQEQQLDSNLEALVDALKDRDQNVRIAAIDAIRGDTSKKAVKILAQSRSNTVYDVRMRAVEGLAKISKDYGDKIAAARQSGAPLALAELCLKYGELGIEDPETTRGYLEDAAMNAREALKQGESREASLLLAKALRLLERWEEAEEVYRGLARENDTDAEALIGIPECRFRRGDLSSLPGICRWVLRQAGQQLGEQAAEALRFWIRAR